MPLVERLNCSTDQILWSVKSFDRYPYQIGVGRKLNHELNSGQPDSQKPTR
jgi:hypothetical protein